MIQYDLEEAKTHFSTICEMVANHEENYVVISSDGVPLVRIVPYNDEKVKRKHGVLEGIYKYDDRFDDSNEEIAELFYGK